MMSRERKRTKSKNTRGGGRYVMWLSQTKIKKSFLGTPKNPGTSILFYFVKFCIFQYKCGNIQIILDFSRRLFICAEVWIETNTDPNMSTPIFVVCSLLLVLVFLLL